VDDNFALACDVTDHDTGAQDHPAAGPDGMDACVVEDGHIAVRGERALDPALAPDNGTPAGDIERNA